ncbi:hypothetical protein BBO99_00004485 [Phytophthora kernoviae]|uniref:ZZ-type domain-containing protein n=1 Tax=Phytophthora kernoviae TaxID=325452 RepID=A0A3R7MN86_9STRA|nr:hypothetical protein JM16_004240 [Phytophthora kernoviae]KAG2527538.1 hypothetical protein JM18_003762 [Phytophthora kernoviae]RLN14084.1 hypothetical protein BBI17_004572 [Phytophthora kernoviae]RLN80459.1 hypothetical protein BBO99_00004485 [Phytophthora kernoviae]
MDRVIALKTSTDTGDEMPHLVSLTLNNKTLTVSELREVAALLLPDVATFSLRYTDSDGDQVTINSDADLKELDEYMEDERLERVEVVATPQGPAATKRAATVVQTQLRGLVTAMSKLTAKTKTKPSAANAMNLLVATLETIDVAEEANELNLVKEQLLTVLGDEDFRKTVDELSASEEFKDLADVLMTAIYEENTDLIEETTTVRFEELLEFAKYVVARCPTLKLTLVSVAKHCMTGLETMSVDISSEEVAVHLGVICDGCEKAPLVGVRYKSLEVPDFDLCEECEASGKWMSNEPFIKITDPSRAPKQKRTSELVHPFVTCDGCEMSPIVGIRFKSKTAEDFDLCEACEASGKWDETHGPFTKIQESGMMHALKFTCRRGGKYGRHDKFNHHHGKFGHHHGHHGKFGHHGHHGKFDRHKHHHGPPGIPFHGPPPHHFGPPGFPGCGPPPPPPHHGHGPPHHEGPPGFPGHGPPGFHGPPDFRGPPHDFDRREHPHGPPGFGPPGSLGRFGPRPSGFPGPHCRPPFPAEFEHGCPPFPREFERWGCREFRGHHGYRNRYTRISDDDVKQQADNEKYRRRHGRGNWRRGTCDLEVRFLEDVTIEDGTVVEAGKPLHKMWRLVNDGERSWPDGCYMVTQRGNPMSVEGNEFSRIELPALNPGEEHIVGVDLVAPSMPGRYTSYWRVCGPTDISFGHRFWVDIVVVNEVTPVVDEDAVTTSSSTTVLDMEEDTVDTEMKDSLEASAPADSASDDDIEIIEAMEAQEADAAEGEAENAKKENKTEYEDALMVLASMGFADTEENMRALTLVDGNIGSAVNALLSE